MNDRQYQKLHRAQAQHFRAIDTQRYLRQILEHKDLPAGMYAYLSEAVEIATADVLKTSRRLSKVERSWLR